MGDLKRGKADLAPAQNEAFHGEGHLSLTLTVITDYESACLPSGGPPALNFPQLCSILCHRWPRDPLCPEAGCSRVCGQESHPERQVPEVGEWKASGCQGFDLKLKTEVDIFHRQRRQCNVVTK